MSRITLVDMDGVLADFGEGFRSKWNERHSGVDPFLYDANPSFYISNMVKPEFRRMCWAILSSSGFYRDLLPISGGREALEEMIEEGLNPFICTSPLLSNPTCVEDKIWWTEKYLGKPWLKRLIITKDKTLVRGDVLVDDKPEIKGVLEPVWQHVLYSQNYNSHVDKPRLTWDNWRDVLLG